MAKIQTIGCSILDRFLRNQLLFFFLFFSAPVFLNAFIVYCGPEIYHIHRCRDGGTVQTGHLDGIRVGIERIDGCRFYLGGDYLYATGRLKGKTGNKKPLRSRIVDEIYEVRVGYTLINPRCRLTFFTPFGGWGRFRETSTFFPPSPVPCTWTDSFDYFVTGFLSGVNFTPLLSMGINFKVKFMFDGKAKIEDEPRWGNVQLLIQNATQYRFDVPLTITPCKTLLGVFFQLCPFYEFRHFGGREDFPFNYKDTKLHLYGARVLLIYEF